MKKIAQFLQLALLVYFLVFLVLFFWFDGLGTVFGMNPLTPESLLKVFLSGFVLFLATWAAAKMHESSMDSEAKKLQAEMNGLKAKLYDFEHPKVAPTTSPIAPKTPEDTTGNLRPRQNFTD